MGRSDVTMLLSIPANCNWQVDTGGGIVQVVDKTAFPVSTEMCGGLVNMSQGGMRQLHWHVSETLHIRSACSHPLTCVGVHKNPLLLDPCGSCTYKTAPATWGLLSAVQF